MLYCIVLFYGIVLHYSYCYCYSYYNCYYYNEAGRGKTCKKIIWEKHEINHVRERER